MIGHIVVGVVGDDEVGINTLYNVHHLVTGFAVVVIDLQIVKAAPDNLVKATDSGAFSCLVGTDHTQLIGGDDNVAEISAGKMADHYLVASLLAFEQGSRTSQFHIIGMAGNNKNCIHFVFSSFCPRKLPSFFSLSLFYHIISCK